MKALGHSIRILREARGITAAALAEKIGLSRAYLSLIENGERVPPAVTLEKLAEGLSVDSELLESLVSEVRPSSRSERTKDLAAAIRRLADAQSELRRKLG